LVGPGVFLRPGPNGNFRAPAVTGGFENLPRARRAGPGFVHVPFPYGAPRRGSTTAPGRNPTVAASVENRPPVAPPCENFRASARGRSAFCRRVQGPRLFFFCAGGPDAGQRRKNLPARRPGPRVPCSRAKRQKRGGPFPREPWPRCHAGPASTPPMEKIFGPKIGNSSRMVCVFVIDLFAW